jgi:hypothetical protein
MRFSVTIDGANVANIALVEGLQITRNSHEALSTAQINFQQRLTTGDKFAARAWKEWAVIEIFETAAPNTRHFAGFISEIQRTGIDNEKFVIAVRAVDYGVLLDRKVSATLFTNATDRAIVKALAVETGQGITATDTTVEFTATLEEFDAQDMIVREAMERLCERTGCRWHVDPLKGLHYYKPGLKFAPFNLSDTPDYVLSFPYQMKAFNREFSTGANRITLLGGPGESGAELRVTDEDAASIATYGVLEAVKIDRTITATAVAQITVDADLADRANPRISGSATVRYPPVEFWRLALGQMLGIKSALYGVDANFVIHGIREYIDVKTDVAYDIEFGAREADIVTTLRMLSRKDAALPTAIIGPGTTIPAENITGQLTADQIGGVYAEDLVGQVAAHQISAVAADTITGSIQADQIGTVSGESIIGAIGGPGSTVQVYGQSITGVISGDDVDVDAAVISGVIVSDQLADRILDSLRLVEPGMAVIERVPAAAPLPTLPNVEYPVGNTVLQSAIYGVSRYGTARYGSVLYENKANVWTVSQASGTLTGILKYNDIESIQAQQITGLIIASQIQSIKAEQITGIIQADQIGSVKASSITGQINADQIDKVYAQDITGSITGDQIGSVRAETIYGTISAASGVIVNANTIQGTITGTNVTIDASRITIGTMSGNRVIDIRGETINIGSIHDGAIGDVSGGKLNVGTVNSDKLNATEISVGGGGGKPGKFGVYGASGGKIGFIGVDGSYEGLWASKGRFGGTGPADAVVQIVDTAFNLQITGTTSTVKISTQVFDPSYSTIGMQVYDTSNYSTWHVSRGLVLYGPGNAQLAALAKSPTSDRGELVLYTSGDALGYILGSGGVMRADRGFQVVGNTGKSVTITYVFPDQSAKTMTFTGGILTSFS